MPLMIKLAHKIENTGQKLEAATFYKSTSVR